MRGHLVVICLLATTFALAVKSKPHSKHHALFKSSRTAKPKDVLPEEADAEQLLPTFVSLEAGSGEQEDRELGANANANANRQEEGVLQATQRGDKSTAVLLSEEELVDLLNKDTDGDLEQEQDVEVEVKEGVDGQEGKADQDTENPQEEVEITENREEAEEEKEQKENGQTMEKYIKMLEEEEAREDDEQEAKMLEEEEEIESVIKAGAAVEGADGSTDSEVLADLDFASDADLSQPLNTEIQPLKEHLKGHNTQPLLKEEDSDTQAREEPQGVKLIPTIIKDEQDLQIIDGLEREVMADQGHDELLGDKSVEEEENEEDGDRPKLVEDQLLATPKSAGEVGEGGLVEKENQAEGDKTSNDTGSVPKGKKKKSTRQRARKHALQGDEAGHGPGRNEPEAQGPNADSSDPKTKRRRTGKWAPLVGMNPVQIRSTAELYPSTKPASHQGENTSDPCMDFRCKRGKTCKLDADLKPACVCQEPTKCPASVNEFDHVCGTDNNTYDTACVLFATKCNLEGTKRGHKLHLDYTGPCKLLAPCLDSELVQFPLRMRDWLKNVLLQLYNHDSMSPGFLTSKQRIKVKKIHENERRLHAGDHPLDLLAQDFEKNYNLYIYPVHWQFAQMDKHPSDRLLSHSELAPLRVPLVPMEHCTSRFFQECDGDQDKQVSFREWAHCFGIKDEDMDVNLLF